MAVIGSAGNREKKNLHQACLNDAKLQAARPSTEKGTTIFRPIPEIAEDGSIRPMVLGDTPMGIDFSNSRLETVVINSGLDSRFSGLAKPSDRPDAEEVDMPFPALYIRLKGKTKRKEFSGETRDKVEALLDGGFKAKLRNAQTMLLMQGVIFQFDDKKPDKPRPRQCMFLTTTAAEAIADCLTKAHKEGIDVFDPKEGRTIILEPEKQRGSDFKYFNATLGDKIPLKVETCKKLWTPWEDALVYHPYEVHMKALINAFGRDIVELAFSRREIARILGEAEPEERTERKAVASSTTTTVDEDDLVDTGDDPGEADPPAKKDEDEADDALQIDTELPSDGPLGDDDDDGEDGAAAKSSSEPDAPDTDDPEALAEHYEKMIEDDI